MLMKRLGVMCLTRSRPFNSFRTTNLKRYFGSATIPLDISSSEAEFAYRRDKATDLNPKAESYGLQTTVTRTSMEVQMCKKSMIELGYFNDPFVECFVKQNHGDKFDAGRRVLYWLRMQSVRLVQEEFLRLYKAHKELGPVQIVNLGCGFDTAGFAFLRDAQSFTDFRYFEIDLPEVAQTKADFIREIKLDQSLASQIRSTTLRLCLVPINIS